MMGLFKDKARAAGSADLLIAAAFLEADAHVDRNSFTVGGEWVLDDANGRAAKRKHDQKLRIARRLRMLAETMR